MRALILLAFVAAAFAFDFEEECGENSHFESCGTACPLTCDNYDNPPKVCVLMCMIGCQCDAGYVKNADGRCVRPEECPSRAPEPVVCGKNQHYSTCASPCPLTCENLANPPKICPAMCILGCECDKGFVKTKDGRCVRPENCKNTIEKTCDELPEQGRCLAYIPQWYHDPNTGKCERFIYGGCGGNGNRYDSEEECLENCRGTSRQQSSFEACDMPAESGVCRGYFPRFYFDRTTGRCEKFVYGGCGGNENNFETIEECHSTCASAAPTACQQEKIVGPCKAYFERFFFNGETGKCERFIYGGCNGNSNNFLSQDDCEAVCAA